MPPSAKPSTSTVSVKATSRAVDLRCLARDEGRRVALELARPGLVVGDRPAVAEAIDVERVGRVVLEQAGGRDGDGVEAAGRVGVEGDGRARSASRKAWMEPSDSESSSTPPRPSHHLDAQDDVGGRVHALRAARPRPGSMRDLGDLIALRARPRWPPRTWRSRPRARRASSGVRSGSARTSTYCISVTVPPWADRVSSPSVTSNRARHELRLEEVGGRERGRLLALDEQAVLRVVRPARIAHRDRHLVGAVGHGQLPRDAVALAPRDRRCAGRNARSPAGADRRPARVALVDRHGWDSWPRRSGVAASSSPARGVDGGIFRDEAVGLAVALSP